eukprot:CAMPEP_0171183228 /NCGR_PEP_ID=MMETSP0790-20130122/15172_1 /TAXON_ID=2925 /ORGANISM="Alexandrium catenella, Strain OF101" /LENGTH=420 /DNA_ID=CAMNT_0011648201 /DNA_START=84 /DNA_END=1342 /DNA_ORIENTATION=+
MVRPLLTAFATLALRAQAGPAEDDSTAFIQMAQMSLGRRQASEDFEEVFRSFDADKSGTLNMVELSAYLKRQSASATPAQARKIMRRSDMNADFALNLDEFLGCASDVAACESDTPQAAQQDKASEGASILAGPSNLGLEVTDFLPDEWASALRPAQVERCTDRDRIIMTNHGLALDLDKEQGAQPEFDATKTQMLQIKGTWVQTLMLPDACKDQLSHAGKVDRPKHAQCLQDSLNITLPCARCNTNFFYNMVHNCATACTPSMNAKACVECTRPGKLLECVEGKARWAELELASGDIQGEPEGESEMKVVGADTPTGELILVKRETEEDREREAREAGVEVTETIPGQDTEEEASEAGVEVTEAGAEGEEAAEETSASDAAEATEEEETEQEDSEEQGEEESTEEEEQSEEQEEGQEEG